MPRLSKLLERLEDTVEARWGVWFQRHKKSCPSTFPSDWCAGIFTGCS